jgi:hypothetical protein
LMSVSSTYVRRWSRTFYSTLNLVLFVLNLLGVSHGKEWGLFFFLNQRFKQRFSKSLWVIKGKRNSR